MRAVLVFNGSTHAKTASYTWMVRDEVDFRPVENGAGQVNECSSDPVAAQWWGLIAGLRYLATLPVQPEHVSIRSNSEQVIKQFNGEAPCKNPRHINLRREAWATLAALRSPWTAFQISRGKSTKRRR